MDEDPKEDNVAHGLTANKWQGSSNLAVLNSGTVFFYCSQTSFVEF